MNDFDSVVLTLQETTRRFLGDCVLSSAAAKGMSRLVYTCMWSLLTLGMRGLLAVGVRPSQLKVGLVQPLEGEFGFEQTAAAATEAIDDAHLNGYLEGIDVR